MSETVNDIRDAIVLELSKYSDDIKLPTKLLLTTIIDIRSSLIRDEIKRSKTLGTGFYQLSSCLEISERMTECVGSTQVLSGYKIDIPGISKTVKNPIIFIGSHDLKTKYDLLDFVPFISHGYRKYNTERPVCTILDDMIVFNKKPIGNKLTGLILFDDFSKEGDFNSNKDVPVPAGIAFRLKTLVKNSILNTYGIFADPINDDSEENVQRKQPVSDERDNNNK